MSVAKPRQINFHYFPTYFAEDNSEAQSPTTQVTEVVKVTQWDYLDFSFRNILKPLFNEYYFNLFGINLLFYFKSCSEKNYLQPGLKALSFLQKIALHKNFSSLAQVL